MVRIINGEIVQDNDPRLKQRQPAGGNSSNNPGTPGRGNVRDVFGGSGSADGGNVNRSPPPPQGGGGQSRQGQGQGQGKGSNPLDMVATSIGIQDRFITIPAVTPLGLTESRVGLIYICAVILACFFFGPTGAVLAVVFYVLWKKSGDNAT